MRKTKIIVSRLKNRFELEPVDQPYPYCIIDTTNVLSILQIASNDYYVSFVDGHQYRNKPWFDSFSAQQAQQAQFSYLLKLKILFSKILI